MNVNVTAAQRRHHRRSAFRIAPLVAGAALEFSLRFCHPPFEFPFRRRRRPLATLWRPDNPFNTDLYIALRRSLLAPY